jgi:phospholipase C
MSPNIASATEEWTLFIRAEEKMFDKWKTSDAPRRTMALLLAMTIALGPTAMPAFAASKPAAKQFAPSVPATPIQHLVVIFDENISFDHYFGTYPVAKNPAGEPKFTGLTTTPTVNGLTTGLLTNNPNLNPANVGIASNPFRLDRTQAVTTDQDHNYEDEQSAFDAGLMDLSPRTRATAPPSPWATLMATRLRPYGITLSFLP